jgi:trimeric autotransporter adhesin
MVQVYPTNIIGGRAPLGVLHLTKPAPAGGAIVTLSAKDGRGFTRTAVPLTVPATVTVPAGAISANFTIGTTAVTAPTPVNIYATIAGVGAKSTVSVDPPGSVKPASLSLNPLTVSGSNPVTGTVTLTGPAPAGGKEVVLGSSYPEFASVPASIVIPAGATSGTFSIATSPVPFALNASIEAVGAPAASLSLKTPGVRMTGLTLSAASATGGASVTGTISFSGPIAATPAPSTSGAIVRLWSSSPAVGLSPLIVVPVGASSATFGLNVRNVPETTPVSVFASYDDATLSKTLTISGSSVSLSSMTVNVSTLTGGQGGVGFVNLTAAAPAGNVLVTLSANDPAISLPPNLTISSGSTSGLFSFGAFPVTTTTPAIITAAFGSSTATASVTVNPGVTVGVTSLTLSPATVTAGSSSTATLMLSGPAPSGGAVVQLSGTSPATVPANVTVPAGANTATFTVGTSSSSSTTQATIYALLNTTWGAVLTVTAGTSAPALSAISLSPSSVVGGNPSQGTATLTAAAPSGGAVVSLSSSNAAVATVPSSVTVNAGSTSATFNVSTTAVSASTPVTISGVSGVSRSSTLNVTTAATPAPAAPSLVSPANGATVALPVLLDWSDVSGAVSYRVQVDDSSGFSTPRVVDQTLAASQVSVGSLANVQHWWRVRSVNSAGTASAWSAVRTLTPQAPPPPSGQAVTVTVTATGRSGERITSSPAGINVAVGSTGSGSFTSGTAITLSVSNGRDAVWSGACSSGGSRASTCRFTPTANASVTANVQ